MRRLGCLRGISTLTAFGLAVEVGDWNRLTGATIGAYLGLVPTESSSGQSRSQGSITKTGNTHAGRLLVEAAWHHRKPYRSPGATMKARWALAPAAARARGLVPLRLAYPSSPGRPLIDPMRTPTQGAGAPAVVPQWSLAIRAASPHCRRVVPVIAHAANPLAR